MGKDDLADAQHRARLLESSIHKVMDERDRGSRGEMLEAGYGKAWMRVTGKRLLIAILIVGAAAAPTYFLWEHDKRSEAMLKDINNSVKESNEIASAQLWLMTISDDERQKLNLTRPRRIVEMQR